MTHSLSRNNARALPFFSSGWLESWVITLTIVGYPLVAAASQLLGVENRPISVAMRAVHLLLSFILLIRFSPSRILRSTGPFWFAWWCFWGLYLLRLASDAFFNPAALKLPVSEYAVFAIGVCLIPGISVVLGNVKAGVDFSLSRLIWLMAVGILLNLFVIFFIQGASDIDPGALRAETEVLNPIALGHLGVSLLLLVHWKVNDSRPSVLLLSLLAVVATVAILAVISSGSRGPVLGYLGALAFYALVLPAHFLSRFTLFGAALSLIVVAFNVDTLVSTFFFERLSGQFFEDDARTKLLGDALELIKTHPVLGAGIDPLETYPHNLIVESFVAFGVGTGLLFCFMIIFAIRRTVALARIDRSRFWICLLFIQYLVGAMLSGAIYLSNVFWVFMALTVTLSVESNRVVSKASFVRHA